MLSSSRRLHLLSILVGAVSVAVVVGVLALAGVFDGSPSGPGTAVAAATPAARSAVPGGAPTSVADIYAQVSPGVVFVSARSGRGSLPYIGPGGGRAASGSGFVIDREGDVVTNQHVIDGATDVRVRFGENGDPLKARVVGQDPSTDIAVLKIDPAGVKAGLKPVRLGDSKRLRPGEATIAIGSPFGLQGTVTTGIVSALDREIQSPNGFPISGVVQTDAAINPGNSGGPLLDAQGRAIGVNSQIATGTSGSNANTGVGFAVPIDTVKAIVPLLERDGKVDRPYVGITTADAPGAAPGAVVRSLIARGPADQAGLRSGDRIVEVAGTPVEQADDVAGAIAKRKPGDKVEIRYLRGADERTATVQLGTRPEQSRRP